MDVAASWDIPNAFGLLSVDFNYDLDSYRIALAFLGDFAGGTDHDHALTNNGGSMALLTAWKGNSKFRRVYEKCRAAAKAEQEAAEARKAAAEKAEQPATLAGGQRFIPLADVPVIRGQYRPDHVRDS